MTRPLTRRDFLRDYRRFLDASEPDWRAALAQQADHFLQGWRVFETTFERADGREVVVALLCRGGFEGERIDECDPPAEVRMAA